ncbi:MAG TPA: hypothetical protein VK034_27340 [Enhygromyxa sp.]|nr:hypothetical protein [Enhygromyxa sp.]
MYRSRSVRTAAITLRLFLVGACIPLVACENLEKRAQYLTGAEAFEWESDNRFHIKGEKDMWGQADVFDQTLSVFFRGFPPGTTLTVGLETATADDKGVATVETNIAALFGSLPTDAVATSEATLEGAFITITPPNKDAIEVPLPPKTIYGVKDTLLSAAQGPVLFTGETNAEGPIRSAIWWRYSEQVVTGAPAPTVADIDAVVIIERPGASTTKNCTDYVDDKGNPQPDVIIKLKDTTVTMYERRTGRKVATKTFAPVDECPDWLTVKKGIKEVRDSHEPWDEIQAWITTQLSA